MKKNIVDGEKDLGFVDPLTEVLRLGARRLLGEFVEAEVEELISHYRHVRTLDGRQAAAQSRLT